MASNRKTITGFDKLLGMNVPHILEKIFLSLDYKSFKKCHGVSNTWKVSLSESSIKKKAKSVYCDELKEDLTELKLMWYCRNGHVDDVIFLVSWGVNPNCFPNHMKFTMFRIDESPLHTAIRFSGNKYLIKYLLDAGADPNHNAYITGISPLYLASHLSLNDLVKLLLDAGADPNKANCEGDTPLIAAMKNPFTVESPLYLERIFGYLEKRTDTVRLLLEGGAEPNKANDGKSPLYWAVKRGQTQLVKLLLDAGAQSNVDILCLAEDIANKDVFKLLIGDPNTPDASEVGFKEVIGLSICILIFTL